MCVCLGVGRYVHHKSKQRTCFLEAPRDSWVELTWACQVSRTFREVQHTPAGHTQGFMLSHRLRRALLTETQDRPLPPAPC